MEEDDLFEMGQEPNMDAEGVALLRILLKETSWMKPPVTL